MKAKDLRFGTLNPISENTSTYTGDRRRTTTVTSINRALDKAYEKDTLLGVNEFNGIVVFSRLKTYPTYKNRSSLLQEYTIAADAVSEEDEDDEEDAELVIQEYDNIAYKVYIPELDPRPAPDGADCTLLRTYSDVYSDVSIIKTEIPLGSIVVVRYEDKENLFNPRIVRVMEGPIRIDGISWDPRSQKPLEHSFINGNTTSTVGGSQARNASNTAGSREAKRLKEIRKEIFLDTTDKWKTARGDLDGPFSKKSNRNWTSNAILSQTNQLALKTKYQSKIDQVATNLGMDVKTLEKIFTKESGIFDPYAINHDTSATGLIQFMPEFSAPATARALNTTVEKLLTMGPDKQLDYVEQYFTMNKRGAMAEEVDWYFIVFYPAAIGKSDSYVIGDAETARVNPGYADPHHSQRLITRRRVKEKWNA